VNVVDTVPVENGEVSAAESDEVVLELGEGLYIWFGCSVGVVEKMPFGG